MSVPALDVPSVVDPPIRVMALHALMYCERLFYLEEVEEIRVADERVYAGRELHESLEAEGGEAWESLELSSRALGLFGKVDCLKRRDGRLVPYEHKRGRCRRGADNQAGAWTTDRVQVVAYAMLVEEAIGRPIEETRVRYHGDGVTVRIAVDEKAKTEVRDAIGRARALRQAIERPPITDNENLCRRCSLAAVCLPEEVRQQHDPDHRAERLFPPDDGRTSVHVISPGAAVGRSSDQLVVRPREGKPSRYPVHEVASVLLHGFAQITTQAIGLCAHREVAVHWLGAGGRHVASLTSSAGQVQRRVRQYRALADPETRFRLARQLVVAKIQGQHRFLLRATRLRAEVRQQIVPELTGIASGMQAAVRTSDLDILRGHEGEAAVRYFGALSKTLSPAVPEPLRHETRTRRPTVDRFSAMLNFGYALLETAVMRAILAVGLEPALGFYHTPRSAAYPLVLDVMELFRSPLWDMVLVASLNRGQWDPEEDFLVTNVKTWLSDSGKRKAIGLFEARLQETWRHPVVDYSLTYARTIELETRLLEKEWTGEPGLFARLRLR